MLRVLLILSVISRANFEMQTFHQQMYVTRKSRSNSNPVETGYVYSKVGKGPGVMTTFDSLYIKPTEKYTAIKTEEDYESKNVNARQNESECSKHESTDNDKTGENSVSSKENNHGVKERIKCLTESLEKKNNLETVIDRVPSANNMNLLFPTYDVNKRFSFDGEDVRTASINTHMGWPYTYQINNFDTIEKAKDKPFLGADSSVIPVHEYPDDYNPSNSPMRRLTNSAYLMAVTTDNPIYGNQPFFSFVLNDYFDKNNEEDPVVFKDFTRGEEFDYGLPYEDDDDNGRSSRQFDYNYLKPGHEKKKYLDLSYKTKEGEKKAITKKDYGKDQDYTKYVKDDEKKLEHGLTVHRLNGFKNFVDSFANKFGSENQNKNSKFIVKQNQDKGEKRNGFRRVYHKDEYQEDNEFYDNTNKKAQAEENGGSNFNTGGSQALLHSHATASIGDDVNSLIKRGETKKKRFDENSLGLERDEINHYGNIAKNSAPSSNADYIVQYRT